MIIQRDLFNQLTPWLGDKKILIIKGARQTGKTTLLGSLREFVERRGEQSASFSVDQDIDNPIYQDSSLFIRYLSDQYDFKQTKLYVFLDEFQYCRNAGLFLKNIFDQLKDNVQLIVSGSSSLEISKSAEFLTGRKIEFRLRPFSFAEFASARSLKKFKISWQLDSDLRDLEEFYRVYRHDLDILLLEYLNWGGYPEPTIVADSNKRAIILQEVIKTYIEKDVAGFLKIENVSGFNKLIFLLADQTGNLVNKSELANSLDLNSRTIEKYLDILQGTFIVSLLKPFFTNKRKVIAKMPKIYIDDPGITKIILKRNDFINSDLVPGSLVENFVFNELSGKLGLNDDLNYYRTISGSEIDFILSSGGRITPIEVKFQNRAAAVPLAIKNFNQNSGFKISHNLILTKNEFQIQGSNLFIPVNLLPFLSLG